jgi:hypothetical protein
MIERRSGEEPCEVASSLDEFGARDGGGEEGGRASVPGPTARCRTRSRTRGRRCS